MEIVFAEEWRQNLYVELYNLCSKLAGERKIPVYCVFPQKVLRAFSIKTPITLEEMHSIKGVGDKKLEQYGEIFLNVIKKALLLKGEGFCIAKSDKVPMLQAVNEDLFHPVLLGLLKTELNKEKLFSYLLEMKRLNFNLDLESFLTAVLGLKLKEYSFHSLSFFGLLFGLSKKAVRNFIESDFKALLNQVSYHKKVLLL